MQMRRSIQTPSCTAPVINLVFCEGQVGHFEKPRPANSFDPLSQALPGLAVFLVGVKDAFDDVGNLRPAWRIIWKVGSNQLVKRRF